MLSPNATWHGNSPAAPAALDALCRIAEVELAEDYLSFLTFSKGGEGPLGIEPGYIVVDSAEEAASQQEEKIFAEFFPGFFKFGGNGAGEMFAFDLRGSKPWPVVMIDMTNCDLKESVIQIADNFQQLLRNIGFELNFRP